MVGFIQATGSGNGGLAAGMKIADYVQNKKKEEDRLKGLASGFLKVRSGDDSGWDELANADPNVAMNMWNSQQALDQKKLEKQFNTTNEIKNYEYYNSLDPEQKKIFDSFRKLPENTYTKEKQKQQAEVEQKALALEANLPAFEKMAEDLNKIGKDVSYTDTQKAYDWIVRQSGLGSTKGAEARERYKQIVANELLPKLRETFGGQLSDAERESLLATLGNVDLSPKEREEAVKSFVESKKRQLDGYKRQLGLDEITEKKEPKKSKYTIVEIK